jgi:phosphatidate phosphatase APP1
MPLKKLIYKAGNLTETRSNKLKLQFRNRLGLHTPVQIIPYITYGTKDRIYLKGRVLIERMVNISEMDTRARNLLNMYKRISSTRIPGARLKFSLNETEMEAVTDEDGYFEFIMQLTKSLPDEELWHHPLIELLEAPVKINSPLKIKGEVLVPPATAKFGVISDIDDTILPSHATNWIKMAKLAFFHNAHTRVPFHGVSEFYSALQDGVSMADDNPVFYVSSSPWNLYDLLVDFFEIKGVPKGPLLLKDYGFSEGKIYKGRHDVHKPKQIRNILNKYSGLSFILIGDSGQKDPEIYANIIKEFPGRILAVYIRNVSLSKRELKVKEIYEGLDGHNVDMIFSEDSYTAAQHAAEKSFLNHEMLPLIKAERDVDEAIEEE